MPGGIKPISCKRPLHRDRIRFDEQIAVQCAQWCINCFGLHAVAGLGGHVHGMHGGRRDIRRHRNHTLAAQQHEFAAGGIVATEEIQLIPQRSRISRARPKSPVAS